MTQPPISRRAALATIGTGLAGIIAAPAILRGRHQLFAHSATEYSARAIKLVEETVVIDMLNQFRFSDFSEDPPRNVRWLRTPGTFTKADYDVYRSSGIRVFSLGSGPGNYEASVKFFADWNGFIAGYDDWFMRIDDVKDFARVKRSGRVGIMITCQTADHFRTVDDVATFFALGQRASQITYNAATRTGSGFLADTDNGLTEYGASLIKRMNEVGMAVDLSHCGDRTTLGALEAIRKPVIISHGSCRAVVPGHLRAKTDEMIQKVAASGGMMGVAFLRFIIKNEEPVTIEHALDHFDHAVKLVGVEHVGVGSDMDVVGNPNPVGGPDNISSQPNFARYNVHRDAEGRITIAGLDHAKRMYDLTEGFIRRKYSDANIKLMLGGNWERTLGTIWPA
ncbi:MAG: membrane dipeptidase [Gemmatimonadaceae bacterium]